MKSVLIATLLAPALALAQPKTADDWYKEGETQYNMGNFDGAADAFKQGFAAEQDDSKKPAYLYNVAQAYRQAGPTRCKDASFFFKRYLVLKDQDTVKPLKPEKRAEIEQRIAELDECAKNQLGGGTVSTTPKTGTGTTTTPKTGTGTTTTPKTGTGTTTTPKTGTGTTATTPKTGTGTTATTTTPKTGPTGTGTTTTPKTGTGTTTTGGGTSVAQGGGEGEGEGEVDDTDDTDDIGGISAWDASAPKLVSARFLMGAGYVSMGNLDVGMRGTFALTGGYPVFRKDKLLVEAGGTFTYTPVEYTNMFTTAHNRASLVEVLANGAATYILPVPKLTARGDLGLGIMTFGGISEMGSPFTENGFGTSGPLTMFAVRLAASADYEITPNIVATATPFAMSISPAKSGLRDDIGAILRFDFMVGVGYRM